MAVATRVGLLASINPPATTITRIYTAPITPNYGPGKSNSFMVSSKLRICNQGIAGTYRVYTGTFAQNNAMLATVDYIAQTLAANATIELPGREALDEGSWMEVWVSHASFSVKLFGTETTQL